MKYIATMVLGTMMFASAAFGAAPEITDYSYNPSDALHPFKIISLVGRPPIAITNVFVKGAYWVLDVDPTLPFVQNLGRAPPQRIDRIAPPHRRVNHGDVPSPDRGTPVKRDHCAGKGGHVGENFVEGVEPVRVVPRILRVGDLVAVVLEPHFPAILDLVQVRAARHGARRFPCLPQGRQEQ